MTISRTGAIVLRNEVHARTGHARQPDRGYSAAEIRIGEHSVQRSCIVTADRLITDWSQRVSPS